MSGSGSSRQVWVAFGLGVLCLAASAGAAGLDDTKASPRRQFAEGGGPRAKPLETMTSATLSQGEWAKLLVGRLGAASSLKDNAPAEDAASLLGARGFSLQRESKFAKSVTSDGAQKTWRYDVDLPRTATWLVTIENGQPAFASVDKTPSKLLAAGGADGASDLGIFPLAAGSHTVTITSNLPAAPDLNLVAGCHPVLPAGGWQPSAKLNFGNLGRTLVQALRQNGRLPASDGLAAIPATSSKVTIDVPSEGTYSVLLSGAALSRATYRLGGCEETTPGAATADGWREGTTVLLASGATTLELFGMDAKKTDGRVRLVRRSSADAEYLAVLQSMGVKLTPEGKTTGSLDVDVSRTGLARRASGDRRAGFAALALRNVTQEDAQRILAFFARQLARGVDVQTKKQEGPKTKLKKDDVEEGGTLEDPVTGTLQQSQDADP